MGTSTPVSSGAASLRGYENEPFIFRRWMIGNLEGRVLTLLETLGFEPKREEAIKSIFRGALWDWMRDNVTQIPEHLLKDYEEFVDKIYTNIESTDQFENLKQNK